MKLTPRCIALALLQALQLCAAAATPAAESDLETIELTCVDPAATGYATFQSHNQKVVANRRGIFMTHLRTRNEDYTAQQWRLSWSRDGGTSFETLYEATHATNPPVLETDDQDNVYLIRPDFLDGNAYLYRFLATNDYREPAITSLPDGAAGKYCTAIDPKRRQLYFLAHNGRFYLLGLDGQILAATLLIQDGQHAMLQYPLLCRDADGVLHAAWTTQKHGVYLYWDIHYLQSADGGQSWRTMAGDSVSLPVIADDGGAADRITLEDEYEYHTWLASFLVREGKAHFLYLAQRDPPRQHYVRYDLAAARRELDLQPEFAGQRLRVRNLDGFFASRSDDPQATLYLVSREANGSRLVCLASNDNGSTWRDYAVGPTVDNPYSIGGSREVTADGWIIGSFTESGPTTDPGGGSKVHFYRIRAASSPPP